MIRTSAVLLCCSFSLSGCLSAGSAGEAVGDVRVLEGIGTPEACLVSDTRCLESKFYVECDLYSEVVIETCLAWLAELEGLAAPVHPQIRLHTATTYYRLAEMRRLAEGTSFPHLTGQVEELLSAEHYRSKVRELSQEVYDNDRQNVGAMRFLSLTSDSDEASLQWQRRIVRTKSPGYMACWLLQGALIRVYSAPAERSRADSEVARCFMGGYRESELNIGKWNVAGAAADSLESAGQTRRRSRFLAEVESDIDPERRIRALQRIDGLAPEEAEFTLETLCLGALREILESDYCSEAIDAAFHSVSGLSPDDAVPYAEALMEGILRRMQPVGMVLTEDLTAFSEATAARVEQAILSNGVESGKIYSTYSMLVSGDLAKSVAAQRRAIELDPQNGDYRVRLATLHTQRGELELAKQQYRQALQYLPDFRQDSLRRILRSRGIELD